MNGYVLSPFGDTGNFGETPDWLAGLLGGVAGAATGVQSGLNANAIDPTTGQTQQQMLFQAQLNAQNAQSGSFASNQQLKTILIFGGAGLALLVLLYSATKR